MDQRHRTDIDDDDTEDSLDGLVLSVVDSLGDDPQAQRQARPTSAPPVEGNSISQNLFLNERQRNDPIQEFLTKSPGQVLGGGIRKRAQHPNGDTASQGLGGSVNSNHNTFGIDEVLNALPQMSLSSPTSPLGQSAARFDFLDLSRTASNHFHSQGGVHSAIPPPSISDSNHHRSLSQGSYAYPLGPQLLSQMAAAQHGSSSTPQSSPSVSEVGDAMEDRGSEAEIQLQIEELQRKLNWQRQMSQMKQHQPQQPQQTHIGNGPSQMRASNDGWSQPSLSSVRVQQPQIAVQQPHMYGQSAFAMNGNGRYDPSAYMLDSDYRHAYSAAGPTSMQPQLGGAHGHLGHHGLHQQQGGKNAHHHQQQLNNHHASSLMGKVMVPPPARVQNVMAAIPTNVAGAYMAQPVAMTFAQPFPVDKLPADAPLEHLEGRFLQLAQEQNGCRYLQQRIAREGPTGAALVLREVFPHLVQLMMDPFANYMYQKLLEHAAPDQRLRMLEAVRGSLLVASLNLHGTRSVQKHIEMGGKDPRQRDIIAAELAPYVTKLSMDTNGNHVVQRMLQHLDRCEFVCEAIIQDLLIVTRHRHGCCVVQRSLDAADSPHRAALVTRIEENALQLMQDPFANYTVQYVIENGRPGEGLRIVELIKGKIETLSKQKFSSNVVERCISAAPPPLLQQFVDEAIACMGELLHDAFANFVAQKLLDPLTSDIQARAIVASMRPHLLDLNPSCSRRVANRIVKRFPDLMGDEVIQRVLGGGTAAPGLIPVPMTLQPAPPPPPPHMASAMMRASHMVAAPQQIAIQGRPSTQIT